MTRNLDSRPFNILDYEMWGVKPTVEMENVLYYQERIEKAHNQTLDSLNDRGGITVWEYFYHAHNLVPFAPGTPLGFLSKPGQEQILDWFLTHGGKKAGLLGRFVGWWRRRQVRWV